MKNMPELKIGVVAVSRDCFPESLSVSRREALIKAYREKYGDRKISRLPAAMRWLYILETLGLKFLKHCLQSISTDRRCLWLRQRSVGTT